MNQKVWSGLASALLTIAIGTTSSCHAETSKVDGNKSEASGLAASSPPSPQENTQALEAVKVGEYQSQVASKTDDQVIAKIHSHELEGRIAATLYVRDIPVLTFVGSSSLNTSGTKVGEQVGDRSVATNSQQQNSTSDNNSAIDPIARATAVAAKLNQLSRDNLDASSITVVWDGQSDSTSKTVNSPKPEAPSIRVSSIGHASQPAQQDAVLFAMSDRIGRDRAKPTTTQPNGERYAIKVNGEKLVEIDAETRLPDTTKNLAEDALQVTNRLRRLIGNAAPLTDIPGKPAPNPIKTALVTAVTSSFRGWASWYGPGFHGNRSASGEIYNQNALTAAHRTLPFGTKVRVTNLKNGLTVVVRINDRGPYIRGRIIDLSAASARLLGMMGSGVAPVRIEVLGDREPVTISAE